MNQEAFFNCVFSFQIVSLEKDNQDQADTVMECFRCFRLGIFPHLCALFLRSEHQIQFTETHAPPLPSLPSVVGPESV